MKGTREKNYIGRGNERWGEVGRNYIGRGNESLSEVGRKMTEQRCKLAWGEAKRKGGGYRERTLG